MQAWRPLEELQQDLRYGWRNFFKTPGFTAILLLTLALGIGANTAVFSIIHPILLRSLPYKESERLYAIWDEDPRLATPIKRFNVYSDLQTYQSLAHSFTEVAGANWAVDPQVMTGHGPAREVYAVPVTANFFSFLGATAEAGRTFGADDVNRGCAVVLSHSFWESALGAATNIIGASLQLDAQSCDVLGVMPRSFAFLPPDGADAWTLITSTSPIERDPNRHNMGVFVRLRSGVTIPAAVSELRHLHEQAHVADRHARNNAPQMFPLREEFTSLSGTDLRLSLLVLFAAVIAVLLIACVNTANLLLGRSLRRQRELAVRAALGCSRVRLLRQLLTENLMLAMAAAVLGCALAAGAVRYFRAVEPVTLPPGAVVEVNLPVLAFTAILSLLTVVLFGFVPAWRGSRTDLNEVLKANGRANFGDRSKQLLGRGLVVFEVMLSLVLLAGAGLLIRSVVEFTSAPLGFKTAGIATMSLSLPPLSYPTPKQRLNFYQRVRQRLSELPDVRGYTLTTSIPSVGGVVSGALSVEGRPEPDDNSATAREEIVGDGYFRFFQIPLLRGREFAEADTSGPPVALVNETLVREYFPHEDPIGKHLHFRALAHTESLLIVGVVRNEKHYDRIREMSWISSPMIYRSVWQEPPTEVHVLVSGVGDANRLGAMVQKELAALDATVPVFYLETLDHFLNHFTAYPKFRAVLLGGFAGLALLLAVVGLYGVLSELVDQRTTEIGVRVALGAQHSDVLKLVLRGGMLLTGAGICLGIFTAWGLTRFLSSLLYGVGSTDLPTFATVSAVLAAAALSAMYLPARRAVKTNPNKALRYE